MAKDENRALLWIQASEAAFELIAVGHRQQFIGRARDVGLKDVKVCDEAALTDRLA